MDYNYNHIAGIQRFRFWCQKVLPAVYDDSLTYYELLCKVISKLNELITKDNEQSEVINLLAEELNELKGLFEQFMESGFEEYYEQQIQAWIDAHMPEIVGNSMKMVFFGCTEDGYFTAYIPESWKPIVFDYGADYSNKNTYGHLILEMYITDTFQINGTPTDLIWEVQNG